MSQQYTDSEQQGTESVNQRITGSGGTGAAGPGAEAMAQEDQPARFFTGAGRGDALEQLVHYTCFSDALLLLLGGAGSGRSSVKTQLLQELAENWQICELDAAQLQSAQQLVNALEYSFAAEGDEPVEAESPASLLSQLHSPSGSEYLLLIDDAHQLSDTILAAVVDLVGEQTAEGKCVCHVILFGEQQLQARVHALLQDTGLCHGVELQPFSLRDVSEYLQFLHGPAAGGALSLSHAQVDEIWRQSQGVPALINSLVLKYLPPADIELEVDKPRSAGLPVTHMIGVVALLTLLVMGYLYREGDSAQAPNPGAPEVAVHHDEASIPAGLQGADNKVLPKGVPEAVAAAPGLTLSSPPAPSGDQGDDAAATLPPASSPLPAKQQPQNGAPTVQDRVAETQTNSATVSTGAKSDSLVQNLQDQPAAEQDRGEVAAASPQQSAKPQPGVDPRQEIAADKIAPRRESDKVAAHRPTQEQRSAAAPANLSADEAKLLALPANNYVLQVLAAASPRSVSEFVARQSNRAQLRVYTTTRSGAAWYVVVTGSYESSQEARRQLKLLPEAQQKMGPWPRRVADIQAGIRQYRNI